MLYNNATMICSPVLHKAGFSSSVYAKKIL